MDILSQINDLFDEIPSSPKKEEVKESIDIKKADMGEVIKDFRKSDAPQFKGKSKKKKQEMAVAAKLQAEEPKKVQKEQYTSYEERLMGTVAHQISKNAKSENLQLKEVSHSLDEERLRNLETELIKTRQLFREATMVSGIGQGGDGQTPGSGEVRLARLDDVSIDNINDGDSLIWDSATGEFIPGAGVSGVTKIIAGTGIVVDPVSGIGDVEIIADLTLEELKNVNGTPTNGDLLIYNGVDWGVGTLTDTEIAISNPSVDNGNALTQEDANTFFEITLKNHDGRIATNTADIATNAANIATNVTDIATNATNIATNVTDISNLDSDVASLDARVDALELVAGTTLFYEVEDVTGAAPTGVGKFTVNNTDATLVTQVQMSSVDKNGETPASPVDGDTLMFVDSAGTGIEHRYTIVDSSLGIANLVVANVLSSGDAWVAGVEYETFLFPTNKAAVVVDSTAPTSPDIGAIWIDSASLIWYAWTGTAWVPAHLPPGMETRISDIETQQTQNTANIAANTSIITSNAADISTNTANIATNTTDIATNTADIATNTTKVLTNEANIATNTADIATNAANIATNVTDIATNAADIATNVSDIATNVSDISSLESDVTSLDARVDALELVTGPTLLYNVENVAGATPTGSGKFTVNNTDASLVTQIQMGALDKNGNPPSTPVDGDTLLFRDSANTGIEHRYVIDDASSGLADLTVSSVLSSGDAWVAGVEYETYLFPTNKSAVVVDIAAPLSPDIGAIWIDSGSLIWYAWTGSAWVPAHLPPSMETRISDIETQQTQNTADIATKISEADGDARYLQLSGGTLTGNVTSEKKVVCDAPRILGAPTNSFIIKGRLGGVDSSSLFYDYKPAAENSLDSFVVYKGSITQDDEITTKKYVDDELASIAFSGDPNALYNITSTGNTWYKIIDLRSNNTYEVLVQVENGADTGSISLTVGIDGFPTRNSFIKVNQVVGTGNYQFRISSTSDLEIKPLDSGTVILKVLITGDANNTSENDIVTTLTTSSAPSSYVETANVFTAKGGGTYGTSGTVDIVDYSNKVQLANVADPTDGTMVGDRDYNDARYEPLRSGTGNQWGSSYNPITLTNALAGVDNYRKIVALQVFAGSHSDVPGWSATYGSSRTKVNFSTGFQAMSLDWQEGTNVNNSRTVYSINKATITAAPGNYLRDSNRYILVTNNSQASNKVLAGMGVAWSFEFYRGSSCGLGCGWTARVNAEYINADGRVIPSIGMFNCNTVNLSNMMDLVLWGQAGYATWGRWNVVADY